MENSRGVKRMILKWLYLKLPVRSCRYVTAISEATKKDIVQYTGCSPDKVIVIPDPSNPGFRHFPKTFTGANPVILQVGTWPNKNLERVAAALEGITCRLHIIGELSEKQKTILRSMRSVFPMLQDFRNRN